MFCWSGCYRAGSCWILAELRFLGSSGLAVLVGLHNQMATALRPDVLRLVGMRPTVTPVLTLTGVLAQFDMHDDVEGALAGMDVPACSGGRLRP